MPWFGLTTCREKTHFLAQVCGETSAFKYLSEINGPQASYAPWYGRGLLQLTGQHNYQSYADYSDDTIIFNEDKLLSLPHSVLSALWYYCNKTSCLEHSRVDDFNMITCIINGGINGYNNRLNYFQSITRILKSEHLNSLCIDGEFLFENSEIYDNATYALSWALWHDPQTPFQGPTKDLSESRKGYERAKTLWGADEQRIHDHRKLYGIYRNHIESFIIDKLQGRQ